MFPPPVRVIEDAALPQVLSAPGGWQADTTSMPRHIGAAVDIVPPERWPGLAVRELWAYRELFLFLVWRDLKVRYAQTVLGAGWVLLQPIATMLVFTVVFGRLAKIPSDGVPYAVFSLTALTAWSYFSGALTQASNSLVVNRNLITKVYFPRLVVPFASILSGVVNFGVTFGMLLVVLLSMGIVPRSSAVIIVPLALVLMMLTAAGVGCWLAALAIQYRDITGVLAFLVQAWMYASPVVYPMSLVPESYRPLYALNPMVGVIEGLRSAMLGGTATPWAALLTSGAVGLFVFTTGVRYFKRLEHVFADVA